MADLKPEIESVSVVLLGSLNPAIFHPAWFAREQLIQRQEADQAEIRIISPELSVFSIGWLALEITMDRFAAHTSQIQHLESLRDLVVGTFSLLRHTPVKQLGINRVAHFRSQTESDYHTLGHRLAPKEPWAGLLERPGMRRVSMQGHRPDHYRGRIMVTVEPSSAFRQGFGVAFEVNDHYEKDLDYEGNECESMLEILKACWQPSLERASHIMAELMRIP